MQYGKVKLLVDLYQMQIVMWNVDHPNYKKCGLRAKALKSIVLKLPGRSKCHFSVHCELPCTDVHSWTCGRVTFSINGIDIFTKLDGNRRGAVDE